jgi:Protein of unknown function (DUF2730).
MGVEQLTFSFTAVQWLVMAAIGLYAWFVGRLSASAREVQELRLRIVTLEERLKHVPSQPEVSEMGAQLTKLDAQTEGLNRELKTMHTQLSRIEQYLLNNK